MTNPDKEIPRKHQLKEHHLRDALIKEFPDTKLIFDKTLHACSRRRPDVFIECYTHSIIIECDEEQHKDYSCENRRVMDIFQDAGNRPLVVIRFNPDSYTVNGNKVKSCFYINKQSYHSVNKSEWNIRLQKLVTVIKKHLTTIPTKELTFNVLFYDEK